MTTLEPIDIENIIRRELEAGDHTWFKMPLARRQYRTVGANGIMDLAVVELAGLPYIVFGMNDHDRPGVSGTVPLAYADEAKARGLVRGVLANVIR